MNPRALEGALADALRRWKHRYAQAAIEDSSTSLLGGLAKVLGESLGLAALGVTWAMSKLPTVSGYWPAQEGSSARVTVLDSVESQNGDAVLMEPYEVVTAGGAGSIRWIRIRRLDGDGVLMLATTGVTNDGEDAWPWLSVYTRGLIDMHFDVRFVMEARRSEVRLRALAERSILQSERLLRNESQPLRARLAQVARTLEVPQAADLQAARALRGLAATLIQGAAHSLAMASPFSHGTVPALDLGEDATRALRQVMEKLRAISPAGVMPSDTAEAAAWRDCHELARALLLLLRHKRA